MSGQVLKRRPGLKYVDRCSKRGPSGVQAGKAAV